MEVLQKSNDEIKVIQVSLENEIKTKTDELSKVILETSEAKKIFEEQINNLSDTLTVANERLCNMNNLVFEKEKLEAEKEEMIAKLEAFKVNLELKQVEEVTKLKNDNEELVRTVEENNTGKALNL